MKKWLLRLTLILIFIENTYSILDLLKRNNQGSDLQPLFPFLNHLFLGFLVIISAIIAVLFILDIKKSSLSQLLLQVTNNRYWFWGLVFLLGLVVIETGQDLLFLRADLPETYYPRFLFESVHILYWGLIVSLELVILLVFFKVVEIPGIQLSKGKNRWIFTAAAALICFLLVVFYGSGYIPYSSKIARSIGYFTVPNTPLPMLHLLLGWMVITLLYIGFRYINNRWKVIKPGFPVDILALIILWGAAFSIWGSFPLKPDNYNEAPRAPTYQYNVISDSVYYEIQSHRLMAGEGFSDDVQHSLYGYLLSGFHIVGGDHFQDIYLLQVALLAISPFILYKIVSLISSAYGGWLLAGLFIIREYNALVLSNTITLSTVHDLMTETVTQLGVVLLFFVLFSWLKDPELRRGRLFLIGCLMGLLMLIRIELVSLVLVVFILVLSKYWNKWLIWIKNVLIILSAVLLLTVPWMTRNWIKTGSFYLDKANFFQRTVQVYLSRIFQDEEVTAPINEVPVQVHPSPSLTLIEKFARHTENNLVGSFLYLASNYQPLGGLDNFIKIMPDKGKFTLERGGPFSDSYLIGYVKTLPYWRNGWDGSLETRSILPLSFVSVMCFVGFWHLWKKNRLIAAAPFLALIIHSATYAVFFRSGGRFILVVDWIPLLYLSVGISHTTAWIYQEITKQSLWTPKDLTASSLVKTAWQGITTAGIILVVFLGISMPVVESIIQPRYTEDLLNLRWSELENSFPALTDHLQEPAMTQVYGKVLYPGYFLAGESLIDDRGGRIPDSTLPRLVFYLVGTENIWVSIPLEESPVYFPHGVDVIIQGFIVRDSQSDLSEGFHPYIQAENVVILDDQDLTNSVLITRSPGIGSEWK